LKYGISNDLLIETLTYRGDGMSDKFAINLGGFSWDKERVCINGDLVGAWEYIIYNDNVLELKQPLKDAAVLIIDLYRQ